MEHNGILHNGYTNYSPEFGFQFIVIRNSRPRYIYFTSPLPNFRQHWTTLLGDNILFPGHSKVSSFLKSATSCKNSPSLKHVFAKHLLSPCPSFPFKSLEPSNPERQVWIDSYNEEEQVLFDHEVYEKIPQSQYLALKREGRLPKAIPSICILVVKNDKKGKHLRANYHIVFLGNFEDRLYQKPQRYDRVPKYSSLRLLTVISVRNKHILQQGNGKSA